MVCDGRLCADLGFEGYSEVARAGADASLDPWCLALPCRVFAGSWVVILAAYLREDWEVPHGWRLR